ncbi:hypothetical protein BDZ91DRAFT_720111 [Kalaharituber pfeilii]|nr:hypothetical protein BDZ91DRAFT_720111 [Kalaharituber pfeilii]
MPSVSSKKSTPTPPATTSGITETTDGTRIIPASVRPNGSTRKEIRIRPGYRPPEDVEVYKNKTAQAWKERGKGGVPGAAAVSDDEPEKDKSGVTATSIKNAKRKAARKKAKEAAAAAGEEPNGDDGAENEEGKEEKKSEEKPAVPSTSAKTKTDGLTQEEKEKQARAIRKKIRQANELSAKKENGGKLLPEELEKVIKIAELARQLKALGFEE